MIKKIICILCLVLFIPSTSVISATLSGLFKGTKKSSVISKWATRPDDPTPPAWQDHDYYFFVWIGQSNVLGAVENELVGSGKEVHTGDTIDSTIESIIGGNTNFGTGFGGPVMAFANRFYALTGKHAIVMVNATVGSSSTWWEATGYPYNKTNVDGALTTLTNAALDYEFWGHIYFQGESDVGNATTYTTNVNNMFDDIIADYPDQKIGIVQIGEDSINVSGCQAVQAAQASIASSRDDTWLLYENELTTSSWHYATQSDYDLIGTGVANALLSYWP